MESYRGASLVSMLAWRKSVLAETAFRLSDITPEYLPVVLKREPKFP